MSPRNDQKSGWSRRARVEHLEVVERGRSADGEAVGVGRDDEAEARGLIGSRRGDEPTELALLGAVREPVEVDVVRLQSGDRRPWS